ncbi:hypothetical protein [Nocardioides terrigena]|uniref:hypothetical protein n=1 Tax=Nocardioides terrigena TaxID=424797 RepID=UPI000D31AD7A|nr:hypothetical protein [Nocardioides terrigena]
MTIPDHGVDLLLRQAAQDLALPDVDRLVAGGVTRGRTRRRRARIGTTFASVAVVGAAALVVPQLLGGDPQTARDPRPIQPATSGPTAGSPDVAPPADVLRPLVPPNEMAQTIRDVTGASDVHEVFVDESGKDLPRLFYGSVRSGFISFRIRWYNNPLVVEDGGQPLAPSHICEPAVEPDCTTRSDGSRLLREDVRQSGGAGVPPTFLERSLTLATDDGWQIDVIAYNCTGEKEGVVVAPEPVLTMAEMEALATSDAWYA